MKFTETTLNGAFLITPQPIEDERGSFSRHWCSQEFGEMGLMTSVVQSNFVVSKFAMTLRGLHYQIAPHSEAKLVQCLSGSIYDVIIDLQPESSTYKQWFGTELSKANNRLLYVPEGFAHGYLTLEDNTEVFYQVSQFYNPLAERGIRWNDPTFDINWPRGESLVLSEKDKSHPDFDLVGA